MKRPSHVGEWVLFALAIVTIPVVLLEETARDPALARAAGIASALVWVAYTAQFAFLVARAEHPRRYVREHWYDLAIIFATPPFVPPEAQFARALRLLRLVRLGGVIGRVYSRLGAVMRSETALAAAAIFAVTMLVAGVAIYFAEPWNVGSVSGGHIWAFFTFFSAGRALGTPETVAGRVIATTIIVVGLGCVAAIASAVIAAGEDDS